MSDFLGHVFLLTMLIGLLLAIAYCLVEVVAALIQNKPSQIAAQWVGATALAVLALVSYEYALELQHNEGRAEAAAECPPAEAA